MKGQQLESTVDRLFEVVRHRSTADEIVFICPCCNDKTGNRSVNKKSGRTNCWKCSVGGDFVKWARWLGYAVEDDGNGATTLEELWQALDNPKPKSIVPVISEIELPFGFNTCYDNQSSVYTKYIGEMAVRKNLAPEDLINAGVGFTRQDSKWEPFAIFPVTEYERLVYYQGRTYWDEPGQTTKKFPSRDEAPLSSKYWIYNIDGARKPEVSRVVVVESILNVLSLQKKFLSLGVTDTVAVCVFKHAVSTPQMYKLLRLKNIKEIVMLFDLDAVDLSWEEAKKMSNLVTVTVASMPTSNNKHIDANDDVDAAWEAIQNRKVFTPDGALQRKIRNVKLGYFVPFLGNTKFDSQHQIDQDCIQTKVIL